VTIPVTMTTPALVAFHVLTTWSLMTTGWRQTSHLAGVLMDID